MIEIANEEYNYFLEENVYPQLNINEITEENVQEVYDFIADNYEVPMIKNNDERFMFICGLLSELSPYLSHKE